MMRQMLSTCPSRIDTSGWLGRGSADAPGGVAALEAETSRVNAGLRAQGFSPWRSLADS